jgi:hypothetical protein
MLGFAGMWLYERLERLKAKSALEKSEYQCSLWRTGHDRILKAHTGYTTQAEADIIRLQKEVDTLKERLEIAKMI